MSDKHASSSEKSQTSTHITLTCPATLSVREPVRMMLDHAKVRYAEVQGDTLQVTIEGRKPSKTPSQAIRGIASLHGYLKDDDAENTYINELIISSYLELQNMTKISGKEVVSRLDALLASVEEHLSSTYLNGNELSVGDFCMGALYLDILEDGEKDALLAVFE